MAKQSGLGDNYYIGGYNVSGDVNALGNISGGPALSEMTAIDKSAMERVGLLRSGQIEATTFFNDATGQEHDALKGLPRADAQVMYFRGTTLGNPAAAMVAKQINYDGTRAADGMLTFAAQAQSNGYGLEWGQSLTAGVRTDTTATLGTSVDFGASTSFGGQAYLQVFSFSGTDVTIKFEDSADNASFALIGSGFEFAQTTGGAPYAERITTASSTTTLRRYMRVKTVTTGGFTSVSFSVVLVKNTQAVTF